MRLINVQRQKFISSFTIQALERNRIIYMKENNGSRKRRTTRLLAPITAVLLCLVVYQLSATNHQDWFVDPSLVRNGALKKDAQWQDLLNGKMTLVGLEFEKNDASNIRDDEPIPYALFCYLENWQQHHDTPHQVPMFRFLQEQSLYCQQSTLRVKVKTAVQAMRQYDNDDDSSNIKLLEFKGAIFHESRVGSTLIANMLASLPQNRVYSESRPPVTALNYAVLCQHDDEEECSENLLLDVLYMMRRVSTAHPEQFLFWKFQSTAMWQLERFVHALPDVPWIFVYRDPVQVMVSHFLDAQQSKGTPKCAQRQKHRPQVVKMLEKYYGHLGNDGHSRLAKTVSLEQYCAANLASLTNTAVSVLQQSASRGRAVNYERLPDILWQDLLPNHFHYDVSVAQIARMQEQAREYSKGVLGKVSKLNKIGTFHGDIQQKDQVASREIKAAAQHALQESYEQLEVLSKQSAKMKDDALQYF